MNNNIRPVCIYIFISFSITTWAVHHKICAIIKTLLMNLFCIVDVVAAAPYNNLSMFVFIFIYIYIKILLIYDDKKGQVNLLKIKKYYLTKVGVLLLLLLLSFSVRTCFSRSFVVRFLVGTTAGGLLDPIASHDKVIDNTFCEIVHCSSIGAHTAPGKRKPPAATGVGATVAGVSSPTFVDPVTGRYVFSSIGTVIALVTSCG